MDLILSFLKAFIGSLAFAIVFEVRGKTLLWASLGGGIAQVVYSLMAPLPISYVVAYLCASIVSSCYAELMARVKKKPATVFLIVSMLPLVPGYGIYQTMLALVQGEQAEFSRKAVETLAITGSLAVGILLVSSIAKIVMLAHQKWRKNNRFNVFLLGFIASAVLLQLTAMTACRADQVELRSINPRQRTSSTAVFENQSESQSGSVLNTTENKTDSVRPSFGTGRADENQSSRSEHNNLKMLLAHGTKLRNELSLKQNDLTHLEKVRLKRVVDGDTLIVAAVENPSRGNVSDHERLRLLCINAPESSANPDPTRQTPEGDFVSEQVRDYLADFEFIYLEYDQATRDQYNRLLAYVWLDQDLQLNEALIRLGWVEPVYFKPNGLHYDFFKEVVNTFP